MGFTKRWSQGITRIPCALLNGCGPVTMRYAFITIAARWRGLWMQNVLSLGIHVFSALFHCMGERKRGDGVVFFFSFSFSLLNEVNQSDLSVGGGSLEAFSGIRRDPRMIPHVVAKSAARARRCLTEKSGNPHRSRLLIRYSGQF